MDVSNMPTKSANLLLQLLGDFPSITFESGDEFMWAPHKNTVFYGQLSNTESLLSLLHETSHGILGHTHYKSDIELVGLELEAWEQTRKLAKKYQVDADNQHIEDCMDTYRNWLHRRSLCPHCDLSGIQIDNSTYSCTFCHLEWSVSSARFCRPYRRVA